MKGFKEVEGDRVRSVFRLCPGERGVEAGCPAECLRRALALNERPLWPICPGAWHRLPHFRQMAPRDSLLVSMGPPTLTPSCEGHY